jgi:hypothetical protein
VTASPNRLASGADSAYPAPAVVLVEHQDPDGARADRAIGAVVRAFAGLGALPTRFFTGRNIALRIVKPA